MHHEEREREEQRKRLEEEIKNIRMGITTAENILTRQRRNDDQIMRHTLFMDKLLTVVDIAKATVEVYFDEKYPEELKHRMLKLINSVEKDLMDISDWIKQPYLSPDHPYGKYCMEQANKSWSSKEESN